MPDPEYSRKYREVGPSHRTSIGMERRPKTLVSYYSTQGMCLGSAQPREGYNPHINSISPAQELTGDDSAPDQSTMLTACSGPKKEVFQRATSAWQAWWRKCPDWKRNDGSLWGKSGEILIFSPIKT
ncbi:hypothetical protein N7456_003187 [Penicillium angulare]|uniref:Uncharacterized protein n=1 Tax=Penicillium angulare TaxID=116970 RepID=A0A9W9FUC4_9EURO|nr:hypothetical protein N7456_003187 [Penicillium angulare]